MQQALSAGVGRLSFVRVDERNDVTMLLNYNIYKICSEMEIEQLLLGMQTQSGSLSGWMALVVVSRTRECRRNRFQVDFEKLEKDFTIFVCFDCWISRKKAKLLKDTGNELDNRNRQ
ncbi:Hypothetical_protein [Hexamita inflata]|uniref:Hypothetical_protein n=1 Tax=Hexamita inflata TaxID=28002 RepID=A0AA86QNI2_9EUKA|nr:Hypothetical protein HINF_LOCUS45053 [Hexamita inflata]